jgi:type I restriction enzyme S subunit
MSLVAERTTTTGGRQASTRHIPPKLALAVGMPLTAAPNGWRWTPLTELARLESGHTPSRRHPEYWGGSIPWLSIQDAKAHHGTRILQTEETTNELGIANSSARVLPKHTVCLSRTASVGYVVVMDQPMATSQDFVNWVCSRELDPEFLQYLLIAEGKEILRFASGSVHQTIYFPEVKAFHICRPSMTEQQRIVQVLDEAFDSIATAKANTETNLQNAHALFESHLQSLFARRLTGWVEKPLGVLASFRNGINYTQGSKGERVKVVGVKDFQKDFFVPWKNLDTVTIDGALGEIDILREGDVLVVRSNGNPELIGRCILTREIPGKTSHSGFTIRIRLSTGEVLPEYLCHFLKCSASRRRLTDSGTGTNIRSLNQQALSTLNIPFPPVSQQEVLVTRLKRMSAETQRLESLYRQKLSALDALKRSFLHQAFTGAL